MAWRFCLPHQRALLYTHVNSGSLPWALRCGHPLYHMLETPTFPSTILSTLWTYGVSQKKKRHKLRTGYGLRHWLPHHQLCPIDGTNHAHQHALIMCANLAKVWQHLANTPVRMFYSMLTTHLADSLSHTLGLIT